MRTALIGTYAIATAAFGLAPGQVGVAQNKIDINVNGTKVYTPFVSPHIEQGRVLVPLRGVFEKLDINVQWFAEQKLVIASKGDRRITLGIGETYGTVNGDLVPLDVPAQIENGRTMVPLRYLAETLGAYVLWDDARRTVVITTRIQSPVSGGGR